MQSVILPPLAGAALDTAMRDKPAAAAAPIRKSRRVAISILRFLYAGEGMISRLRSLLVVDSARHPPASRDSIPIDRDGFWRRQEGDNIGHFFRRYKVTYRVAVGNAAFDLLGR